MSKFWGGIVFHGVKQKSQFSVLSVATGINSPQQVGKRFFIFASLILTLNFQFLFIYFLGSVLVNCVNLAYSDSEDCF